MQFILFPPLPQSGNLTKRVKLCAVLRGEAFRPPFRDGFISIDCSGETTRDRADGICIAAEVDGLYNSIFKAVGSKDTMKG